MKNKITISVFLLFMVLSCQEPPVVFTGPQPESSFVRSSMGMLYRGTFLCDSDSSIVHVKNKIIYKEKTLAFTMTPEEIEELKGVDLMGDLLIIDDWPEPLPARITDSLVYADLIIRDTLFNMGPDQILKYYKGHMVLNKKLKDDKWEVIILSLDERLNIEMSIAVMPADLEKLNKLSPVTDISTEDQDQILLSPTYLEFDEIFRQQLIFEECDFFVRVTSVLQT